MSLVALIVFLIGNNNTSIVGKAFDNLINDFFKNVNSNALGH